jgi:hypothetical protein
VYSASLSAGASSRASSTSSTRNVAAAAAAAAGGDAAPNPWKTLGVEPGADADEITKVLNRKKLLYKTEPGKLAVFEEAYDAIVQASLSARLRGDVSGVDKNILGADKTSLFGPWAPKYCMSPMKDIQINVAIAAAAMFFVASTTATLRNLQPIIYGGAPPVRVDSP